MRNEECRQAARLLRNYAIACDNILYKHGDHTQDQRDAEDLADKLEGEGEDEFAAFWRT